MPIAAPDGIDDWIAPAQPRSAADGLDDWIAPTSAPRDPDPDDWIHPDDWLSPAPSPAPGAAPPVLHPRASSLGIGLSNQPAPQSDTLADYRSLVPAAQAGAMAWQPPIFLPPNPFSHENIPASKWLTPPPIFLNPPGQPPSPTAATPSLPSIPTGGLFDSLANLPATNAPRSGLLDGLANLPAEPDALPWFQQTGSSSGEGGQSLTRPFPQNPGNRPSLPQSIPSGDFGNVSGYAIEGSNTDQYSAPDDPSFIPPFNLLPGPTLPPRHSEVGGSKVSPFVRQLDPTSGESSWFATSPSLLNSDRSSEHEDVGDNSAGPPAASSANTNEANSVTRVVRDPSGRALAIIHVQPTPLEDPRSQSDATPDSLRPGEKFAQINNAVTGRPIIDRTTDMLLWVLQESVLAMGAGAGARFGTAVHVDFANRVKKLDLPGIGKDGVEQSFRLGLDLKDSIRYGFPGTIRTDVTLRDPKDPRQRPIAVYDLKTGYAVLTPRRVEEIYDNVDSPGLLIIELQYRTGDALDRTEKYPRR